MKTTIRDNWRVIALISPTKAPGFLAVFGATEQLGNPMQGHVSHATDFEITVRPDGPNWAQVGEVTYLRENEGEKGCEVIHAGLMRHPHVVTARIEHDVWHGCSHCNCEWEELGDIDEVSRFGEADCYSVVGEPLCCTKAINEFRAEKGIPLLGAP